MENQYSIYASCPGAMMFLEMSANSTTRTWTSISWMQTSHTKSCRKNILSNFVQHLPMHHLENNLMECRKTCLWLYFWPSGTDHFVESEPGKYHQAYDCLLEQDILFRIDPHCLPADNPAQAESSSGSGAKSNYRCRYDKSGGTAAERETDEGYHAQFEVRHNFCEKLEVYV